MRASILAAVGFAAALVMSATAGSAATVFSFAGGALGAAPAKAFITPGDDLIMTGSIGPNDSPVAFVFENSGPGALTMDFLQITANGELEADVASISASLSTTSETVSFTTFPGTGLGGGAFTTPFVIGSGEEVTVTFSSTTIGNDVALTLNGGTSSVVVPLPAGLPLLLTAAGGLMILRRRQKADA